MSALRSIAIAGFKSFGDEVEVSLGPLNVLIGANGAGKSNFLGAFSFLRAYHSNQLRNHIAKGGGGDRFLNFGSRTTQELSLCVGVEDSDYYTLKFYWSGDDYLYLGSSRFPEMGVNPERRQTQDILGNWRLYHFLDTSFHSPMVTAQVHRWL